MLLITLVSLVSVRASAYQDPLVKLPQNYQLQFENDWVKVVRVVYGPKENLPSHDHPSRPTIYVYLSDSGSVRFTHTGFETFTLTRPAAKTGSFRLANAAKETHKVENLSSLTSRFLRVELKTKPADPKSFRGRYPSLSSPSKGNSQRIRFQSKRVQVTQIDSRGGIEIVHSPYPSLLVAITTAQINIHAGRTTGIDSILASGDTMWLEPKQALRVGMKGNVPAKLLRIEFVSSPESPK
jgi:hypothetical protein